MAGSGRVHSDNNSPVRVVLGEQLRQEPASLAVLEGAFDEGSLAGALHLLRAGFGLSAEGWAGGCRENGDWHVAVL